MVRVAVESSCTPFIINIPTFIFSPFAGSGNIVCPNTTLVALINFALINNNSKIVIYTNDKNN